jgi:undecaprenyl-phosphate 4-deoxy-4-formamido-L-arabinose transferase
VVLAIRRMFFTYTAAEGLFTLFGILFFLMSVAIVGIGLIGEYVGRTYQVVRARQRYFVREVLEK